MRAQAQQVFANIQTALEAVGASFNNVAKLTFFVLDATQMPTVRKYVTNTLSARSRQRASAFEVRRLVREEFLIEVETVAILDS